MKNKTRIFVLILAMTMLVSMFTVMGISAAAEETSVSIGSVQYSGEGALADAVAAAKSGDVITLESDIALSAAVVIGAEQSITINLNGHGLTADAGAILNNGTLTIVGEGSVKGDGVNTIVNNGTLVVNAIQAEFDIDVNEYLPETLIAVKSLAGDYVVIKIEGAYPEIVDVLGVKYWSIGGIITDKKAVGVDGNSIERIEIVNYEIILHYTNGETKNIGSVRGDKGDPGRTIESVELDEETFKLIVKYSDGTSESYGPIKGEVGFDGRFVKSVVINDKQELVVSFDDDTEISLGCVKGDKGDVGNDGKTIASIVLDDKSQLVITFTDGSMRRLASTKGDKGDKGDIGDIGPTGADGNKDNVKVIGSIAIATICVIISFTAIFYRRVRRRSWWSF